MNLILKFPVEQQRGKQLFMRHGTIVIVLCFSICSNSHLKIGFVYQIPRAVGSYSIKKCLVMKMLLNKDFTFAIFLMFSKILRKPLKSLPLVSKSFNRFQSNCRDCHFLCKCFFAVRNTEIWRANERHVRCIIMNKTVHSSKTKLLSLCMQTEVLKHFKFTF